ncbi:MAG: FAD/NAD(P)-binding protein [Anaerolineae bacterium]|nr:MAG: FAD/NAD(P)-binding protein [Anaerolineae bacterium]
MADQGISSPYQPTLAEMVKIEQLTETEKLFTLHLKNGHDLGHRAGQFVEVSVFGIGEAPISVTSSPTRNGTFELCVREIGDVTSALHRMTPGSTVGIRGPFGNGFPVEKMRGKDLFLVPAGIGLPPMRSLIHQVLDEREFFGRLIILYGARTPSLFLYKDELIQWKARDDVELYLTVDRGDESWTGNVGVITTLFPQVTINPRSTVAVTVGPPVMYRFVIMEFLGKGIQDGNIYLSLERRMKCGLGKCGHCQINDVYVCQKGPVFSYAQLKELPEAI